MWDRHGSGRESLALFRQLDLGSNGHSFCRSEFRERRAEHGSADRTADQTVEPVVVVPFRSQFPFIDRASAPGGLDAVFRRQMFGKKLMLERLPPEERKATFVPHWNTQPSMNETFPEVRVENAVSDGSFAADIGDHPVQPQPVAGLFLVFGHRFGTSADVSAMGRQQDCAELALAAELIDDVG